MRFGIRDLYLYLSKFLAPRRSFSIGKNIASMNFNGFIIMFRMLALYPVLPAKSMVSRLLELYSLLMILYGCCITIYVFHICHYYSGNTVYDIVGALKVFILIVTHISIVIHAFTSRKTQVDILKMFDHIDSVMVTQLFIKIVPKSISKKFAWEQIAYIAILLASYTHYFICISMYVDNFFVMPIIGTTRMRCVQILFYVGLLQERLEMINDELSKIIKPPAYGHSLFRKAILENENYEKIVILKNLYGCIWEISNMLNDCFGWSFVIMATEQFVEMLSNANVIFIVLVTPELPNSMAMYVLFEGFPSFFTFTIVCIHCHFCSEKVNYEVYSLNSTCA